MKRLELKPGTDPNTLLSNDHAKYDNWYEAGANDLVALFPEEYWDLVGGMAWFDVALEEFLCTVNRVAKTLGQLEE